MPLSFLLKNTLQLDALQLSQFRLVVSSPLYFSFVFGLLRDHWSPLGWGDRGHLVLFGTLSAVTFATCAFIPVSVFPLLAALVILTAGSLFIASAQNGLAVTFGQQHAMTGQISTVWNVFTAVPTLLAFLIGGRIGSVLEKADASSATRELFLIGAAGSLAIVAFSPHRACRGP